MSRACKHTSLPPPYLKRVWIDEAKEPDGALYPFCLPLFRDPGFELAFPILTDSNLIRPACATAQAAVPAPGAGSGEGACHGS